MIQKNILQKIFLHIDTRKLMAACLLCSVCLFSIYHFTVNTKSASAIQMGIASQIIRFHVIANSDSLEDQNVKLKVKGAVTSYLKPILKDTKDANQARELINSQLLNLTKLAEKIVLEDGFSYSANASIAKVYFPLKVYGDLSLPPGEYEALRIELGEAKGQNWWCIMFPPLCFVDSTYSIVPKDSKEQLKHVLTDSEYKSILSKEKPKVKVKLKLFSLIEDLLSD